MEALRYYMIPYNLSHAVAWLRAHGRTLHGQSQVKISAINSRGQGSVSLSDAACTFSLASTFRLWQTLLLYYRSTMLTLHLGFSRGLFCPLATPIYTGSPVAHAVLLLHQLRRLALMRPSHFPPFIALARITSNYVSGHPQLLAFIFARHWPCHRNCFKLRS